MLINRTELNQERSKITPIPSVGREVTLLLYISDNAIECFGVFLVFSSECFIQNSALRALFSSKKKKLRDGDDCEQILSNRGC